MPLEEQLETYKRLILLDVINFRVFDCKLDIDFH